MSPIVAVSFKAYFGREQMRSWLARLGDTVVPAGVELALLPALPWLPEVADSLAGTGITWGAQDVAPLTTGAQTGAVTAGTLAELGCKYVEVGHAERHQIFHETAADTRQKIERLTEVGITPLICVGELSRAATPDTAEQMADELTALLAGLTPREVLVAYEPVWAIGAPAPAPASHVREVTSSLTRRLRDVNQPGRVLYGGAAGPGTLTDLTGSVDGVFLGRFAHDVSALAAVMAEAAAPSFQSAFLDRN